MGRRFLYAEGAEGAEDAEKRGSLNAKIAEGSKGEGERDGVPCLCAGEADCGVKSMLQP
jgi:hypothetical protein